MTTEQIKRNLETTWLVWDPSGGETIEDALEYTAYTPEDAAGAFVESCYDGADHFESMTVHVTERLAADQTEIVPVYEVTVRVDFSVDFLTDEAKEIVCPGASPTTAEVESPVSPPSGTP